MLIWMWFKCTPQKKTNISPENRWLEDEMFFQMFPCSGDMLILGRVLAMKG